VIPGRRGPDRARTDRSVMLRKRHKNIAPASCMCDTSTMSQRSLFGRELRAELARTEHGGAIRRGRRKLERPVSTRRPMHVVLSSRRAEGPWSMRKHQRAVREALRDMARRFGVRIYDFANVGSHLHLLIRTRRRETFQAFLRSFAGIVARRVTGARRGRPSGAFFSGLAWSRVVNWGRDYFGVRHYVFRNQIEGTLGPRVRQALEQGPPTRGPKSGTRAPP
jgi:REP element-mobilizing transposase RayT